VNNSKVLNQGVKYGYYIFEPLDGYRVSASKDLVKRLEELGFRYELFEGGGGGESKEVIHQIIAHLTVDDFWLGVFSSLLASRIEKVLTSLFKWYQANRIKGSTIRQVVTITIKKNKNLDVYSIDFDIVKKHSHKEILEKIKKARK